MRAATRGFRIDGLLQAAAYPHAVAHLRLEQTAISWVVLTGRFAYKIKKPVRYEFIDASTLERRRALCTEELRLNRRFAPDLYVDVVPIAMDDGQLRVAGKGEPVEYAVRMHEFDPSQELDAQLAQNAVTAQDMSSFAAQVADLYLRAAVAREDSPYGTPAGLRARMLENFVPLRAHLSGAPDLQRLEQLSRWTAESLSRLQPLIEARRRAGMVRECHGDLHARNIVRWQQQWIAFDCLEFDPDLRWIDVLNDVAFLFMDLVSREREDLAHEFLSRYLEETGDYDGLRLLPLFAAYRALVRAKVDALGAESAGPDQRRALDARLAGRLRTAMRFVAAKSPALIIMHGVTASGKSWLSERLISAIPALRIRSDLERKRLAGVAPTARRFFGVGEGEYTEEATARTYGRLLECAESALDGGCSVVIDATFLDASQREMFRALASRRRIRFLIVSCAAHPTTLAKRVETRARSGLNPSEATHAVLDEQLRSLRPLTDAELPHSICIDTNRLAAASAGVAEIRSRLASTAVL